MTRRRGTATLVASPVLVGAVTLLVSIIAVFLAYNANQGLPFVPTYDVKAELPSGAKLVKGNEVRVGGFRVGVVEEITPVRVGDTSRALVSLKLDKIVEPLRADTRLRVRPRSALGLKYVEMVPSQTGRALAPGSTIPLAQSSEPLDFEDVLGTFDDEFRPAAREATEGFGDAFAGRGSSINAALEGLNPFFTHLAPVMSNLADPETNLDNFFRQLGRAAAQAAPVADVQAQLFSNMADTFAAIGANPRALQLTIEKGPPTMDTAVRSFRVQRPFLGDFADLSRRLRPAARQLPRSLPALNRAFRVGTPILPRTVRLNADLRRAFVALDELFENPNTLLALRDLRSGLAVLRPLFEYLAPYQTVCNYPIYFIGPLGEHMSGTVSGGAFGGGTAQGQGVKGFPENEHNSFDTLSAPRPADTDPGEKPRGADANEAEPGTQPQARLFGTPYAPAIDAQGNADCQFGQTGYPNGPLTVENVGQGEVRYDGGLVPGTDIPTGGNGAIALSDYPVLTGKTYKGVDHLRDVP